MMMRRAVAAVLLLLLALVCAAPHAELRGGLTLPQGKRLLFTSERIACTEPDKEGDVYLVSETHDLLDAGCWWRRGGDSVLIDLRHQSSIYVLPARAVEWVAPPDPNRPSPPNT